MLRVGVNFKGKTTRPLCPICKVEYDSQSHLLACPKLNDNNRVCQDLPYYDYIFIKTFHKQVAVVRKLHQNFKRRQKILNENWRNWNWIQFPIGPGEPDRVQLCYSLYRDGINKYIYIYVSGHLDQFGKDLFVGGMGRPLPPPTSLRGKFHQFY